MQQKMSLALAFNVDNYCHKPCPLFNHIVKVDFNVSEVIL